MLLFGVSHRSAPVSVLEQLSIGKSDRAKIVNRVLESSLVNEVMVLSTCNRVEVYAVVDAFHGGLSVTGEVGAIHQLVDVGVHNAIQGVGAGCHQYRSGEGVEHQQRRHVAAPGEQHRGNRTHQDVGGVRLRQGQPIGQRAAETAPGKASLVTNARWRNSTHPMCPLHKGHEWQAIVVQVRPWLDERRGSQGVSCVARTVSTCRKWGRFRAGQPASPLALEW